MMVLGMVPLTGAIPVWAGAVVYRRGRPSASGLDPEAVHIGVVVGITDDYLRRFAVIRYADPNPAVIIGGGYAFGMMALFRSRDPRRTEGCRSRRRGQLGATRDS